MSPQALPNDIPDTVARALAEDLGSGDITAALIDAAETATATVRCRESAIVCGTAWFDEVFHQIDPSIIIDWHDPDGSEVGADDIVCSINGSARHILSGERTALNFLQTLSATASATHAYADRIKDTHTRILDTRKTLPGLRSAQKYAVRCGGGTNHRQGLFDAVLIKENHIAAAGSITAAVSEARRHAGRRMVEVEVETLQELSEALATDADRIMLDNFDLDGLTRAVELRNDSHSVRGTQTRRVELEASGDMSLDTIRAVAETGVDFISVGSLTKHIRAVDYSMRFATTR